MTLRSCFSIVPRQWKTPRTLRILFLLELALSIAALALFGIAQPDLYRTRFWQEGSKHGWNSNPDQLIYAYANYKPIKAPLPWSQFITNFNVVISIVSIFVLLCKLIMTVCGVFHPLISLFVHAALVAIWAVSIHGQAGPDMSDPAHPQPGAPCALFATYLILTLYSLYPSKSFREERRSKLCDSESGHEPWEMLEAPKTPGTTGGLKSPTTPRTKAFNILSSKGNQRNGKTPERRGNVGIPLRHHVSMGEETYQGSNTR
ncbi:MAG: hypothetical protein Q9217_000062 [Psora testacea]